MAKTPFPAFTDWQAPWEKEGEELSPDGAKRILYDFMKKAHQRQQALEERDAEIETLTTQRDEAVTKVKTFEDKDLSEVEKLRRDIAELKAPQPTSTPDAELRALRAEVALEKGLTASQAKRLVGTTAEEMAEDADTLLADLGKTPPAGGGGGGEPRPTPRRIVNGRLRTGLEGALDGDGDGETYDPGKLAADLPRSF